jgi:uncharacterized protein involved in type VI secretion and phage assembly
MNSSELNNVQVDVIVDGEKCDYTKMKLFQTMSGHHTFMVVVNYRPGKPTVWTETPEKIFDQLGKNIGIRMKHRQSGESNDFRGIITDIEIVGQDGDQGVVVLKGGSPTLLMDKDPSMAVFSDRTLASIITETIEGYGLNFELENKPKFETTIPYVARYRETGYSFLSRLAASCGDWFYYNGKKLIVGNPQNDETRRVAYDVEIKSISISAGINNLNTEIYDYNAVENDYFEDAPDQPIEGVNSYMDVAKSKSETIYKTTCKLPMNRAIIDENDIMQQMKARHSRSASQLSNMRAEAKTCAIRLGELVSVRLPESHQKDVGPDLGRYRVVEVAHQVDEAGIYSNTFRGVAGGTEMLPDNHIITPTAFPEPATITDNADPLNMGRVKVRYYWQDEDDSTNWMRLQGQSAGSSGVVKKNRGMVFIPEVDDQVMVAFEQGNPDRPYVTGSLFHRDNAGGAATDNNIKSITTRSGHTIEFDDTDEAEKITIKDNGGNIITLDKSSKSIEITASGNITFTAEEINMQASNKVNIESGADIRMSATENMAAYAKQLTNEISESTSFNTKSFECIAEKADIQSTKENLTLSSGKEVAQSSKSKKIKLS